MIIKIAIIVFLIALLFGCSDGGDVKTPFQVSDENVSVSLAGGEEVYRTKFIANGMTYEAVYVKRDQGMGNATSISLQLINLTLDSLKAEQTKLSLQP